MIEVLAAWAKSFFIVELHVGLASMALDLMVSGNGLAA